MSMQKAPYIFHAYSNMPACNAAEAECTRINFLAEADRTNLYAKAFVMPQSYSACAAPAMALHRGSFFNDLYKPYTTVNTCCKEVEE